MFIGIFYDKSHQGLELVAQSGRGICSFQDTLHPTGQLFICIHSLWTGVGLSDLQRSVLTQAVPALLLGRGVVLRWPLWLGHRHSGWAQSASAWSQQSPNPGYHRHFIIFIFVLSMFLRDWLHSLANWGVFLSLLYPQCWFLSGAFLGSDRLPVGFSVPWQWGVWQWTRWSPLRPESAGEAFLHSSCKCRSKVQCAS